MLQPLRQNPRRTRVSRGESIPAPVEGWDAISPLATMKETRAPVLTNWFPQPGYVEVRKGNSEWSTGVVDGTTSVETLMCYNGLTTATDAMFSIGGGSIYDSTDNAAASVTTVTGLTNSRFQYVNYTTSGGTHYIHCCNGADDVLSYDGSTWSNPSFTGITSSDVINLNVHKQRIWGIINGSMDAFYLATDAISGTATKFPLGSVMKEGGYLMAMATWTRDGGAGPDDYAVFISSRGQVAVYGGIDPSDSTDFVLVGVYQIPPPIGRRCFTRVAGDIAVITISGVIPLSRAIQQDRAAEAGIALTLRINNAMNTYAQSYKSLFGWELTPYPLGTMAILNIPIAENVTNYQAVMNTLTGAWCLFTGWDFNCFAVFQDNLYAGANDGTVRKCWTGATDDGTTIDAQGQCAYNYFSPRGRQKRFVALQPLITTDQDITPSVGISTDFRDNASVSTPSSSTTNSALYDSAIWDTDVYAAEARSSSDWTSISGIGDCAAVHFRCSTNSTGSQTVKVNGFHIIYETGEFF